MHACTCMKRALRASGFTESKLLGVYVRGSLPQGCAIEHVSDIDMSAYVLLPQSHSTAGTHKDMGPALAAHVRIARDAAVAKFDFVVKAGVDALCLHLHASCSL